MLASCTERGEPSTSAAPNPVEPLLELPDTNVLHSQLRYDNKRSIWTLNEELYSGYSIRLYQDSTLQEKFGVFKGKKQGQARQWFPDGHPKQIAHYHKGKLHGEKKRWSPDSIHVLLYHLNYHSGKPHGKQKTWYPTGELFKKLNMNMGREEGIQQAYRKNGVLYANYEAKNGRIFGMKKAALCFGLEEESMQKSK